MPDPAPAPRRAPDTGDVRAVHSGLRREFRLFPDLLVQASTDGDTERLVALGDHWAMITSFLHRHHEGEDEILWPLLERDPSAGELVALMQSQHHEMLDTLAAADTVVTGWSPGAEADVEVLRKLAGEIAEHFDAEEAEVLPIAEAHLAAEEWEQLGVHGRAGVPAAQMPIVACLILEDADPAARAAFLAPMPPGAQQLLAGPWQEEYARYAATLRGA